MGRAHNFGNDWYTCFFLCLKQQFQSFGLKPLKVIWRSSRLKCATTKKLCSACFNSLGNFNNLVAAFYRTRACNKSKVSSTNFYTAYINDCIFRMELSVCLFIWFTDSCNRFNNIKPLEQVNINFSCITNESKNSLIITFGKMNLKSLRLKPFNKIVNLLLTYTRF